MSSCWLAPSNVHGSGDLPRPPGDRWPLLMSRGVGMGRGCQLPLNTEGQTLSSLWVPRGRTEQNPVTLAVPGGLALSFDLCVSPTPLPKLKFWAHASAKG